MSFRIATLVGALAVLGAAIDVEPFGVAAGIALVAMIAAVVARHASTR